MMEACRRDRLFWFNVFLMTYDPRKEYRILPFITYDYQDDIILWDADCMRRGVDNAAEKSRDMGATWMFLGNDFYDWLFETERIETRWGSRKEQYVDTKGDMDSIFEKIRFIAQNLPSWMLPKGFSLQEHSNNMRFINPATGSIISGEATNENFSRGGRKRRIRYDEFAFWDVASAAWKASADSTLCRTALSTPNGASGKFSQLLQGTKDRIKEIRTIHWTLHPDKGKGAYYIDGGKKIPIATCKQAFVVWKLKRKERIEGMKGGVVRSPWYDAECERRTDKEIAEELDIDYFASGHPFFDLYKLEQQRIWEPMQRALPSDPIPYGKFIKGTILDIEHKLEFREIQGGWLRIFEMPQKGHQYIVGGDTSEGLVKGDESYLIVRDKYYGHVVASSNGLFKPDDFELKLQRVGKFYRNARVAPENNNMGYAVCQGLEGMDCNLYYTTRTNKKGEVTTVKAGWTTSSSSRYDMLKKLGVEVDNGLIELRDPAFIQQCKTFAKNEKGKPEATGDFLDDGVIAGAICSAVIHEEPYKAVMEETNDLLVAAATERRSRTKGF